MAAGGRDHDIEQRVYLERVRIFIEHAYGGQLRTGLAFFFIGLSLYFASIPASDMAVWATFCFFDMIALTATELIYRRTEVTQENVSRLINPRIALILLTSVLIGASPFMLPATGSEIAELMIFVIVVTAVAVACISFTTMPPYFLGFTVPALLLLSISFLRAGDSLHYTLAVMAGIILLLLIRRALEVSRRATAGIRVTEQLKIEVEKRQEAERDAQFALDIAQRANNAKTNFLANMSHELRTPMNAIIGFSGALRAEIAGPLNGKQAEYIEDIENSGLHLLSLVNDLLDLSKIEAGKLSLNPEIFKVEQQLRDCLPMISDQAGKAGVEITLDLPSGLPDLNADPRLFSQMIVNLLSNAVKFTDSGKQITITAGILSGGSLAVSVIDEGAGMSAEEIPVALRAFEQTELGRSKEGTGLGLPLVKRMAELHGGFLSIESAPGEGTTATIGFPAHRIVRQQKAG